MSRHVALIAAAALAACAAPKPAQKPFDLAPAPAGTLTIGLIVSSGTSTAQEQSDALAAVVSKAIGKNARAAIFPDYDTLASWLSAGKVDIGFLPPMAYVRATAQGKVVPLVKVVRNNQAVFRSVLFSAAGSPVTSLDVLKKGGLKVAWVDPSSASGYIFAKALLLQKGINPAGVFVDQSFLESHDAVCKAVMEGKVQVGASYSTDPVADPVKTVTACRNALGDKAGALQVVVATEGIPNDVVAVRDGFAADDQGKLSAALLGLEKAEDGKRVLTEAFHAEGFTPAADEDYTPVRAALQAFKQ
jgi:phosphate/phosphite/phosphonate ABC transporter binding protein